MNLQLPEPVQLYPLPDGGYAKSAAEYAAKAAEAQAVAIAQAYVDRPDSTYERAQKTRAFNIVRDYLMWNAGQAYLASQAQAQ